MTTTTTNNTESSSDLYTREMYVLWGILAGLMIVLMAFTLHLHKVFLNGHKK